MRPEDYQELIKDGCPWCGEGLVIKRSRYGEFIACADWCGYKKSIWNVGGLRDKRPAKCPSNKCDGSGLLPFTLPDGTISKHTKAFCDCHPDYGIQPEQQFWSHMLADFDCPTSDTFRAHSYQYCGLPDPGYIPPEPEAPLPQVIEHRHSDMSQKDFAKLNNLEGQVKYLQGKLTEKEQKRAIRYEDYE